LPETRSGENVRHQLRRFPREAGNHSQYAHHRQKTITAKFGATRDEKSARFIQRDDHDQRLHRHGVPSTDTHARKLDEFAVDRRAIRKIGNVKCAGEQVAAGVRIHGRIAVVKGDPQQQEHRNRAKQEHTQPANNSFRSTLRANAVCTTVRYVWGRSLAGIVIRDDLLCPMPACRLNKLLTDLQF
jgi:hypothetical protein